MGIIFDLVIVAIIVLSTFLAYRKGLAVLAIKLCSVCSLIQIEQRNKFSFLQKKLTF